ncbi:metallophosphoesterase [Candidatus Woesebacteria bacterium]|nr:metallophosphoesterase [Candidatus Woesebacteria bacterium]
MKIGVISDTHDHFPGIDWAHQLLVKEGVDAICHCGDWVSPFTMEYFTSVFSDFQVPVYSVFGNNEGDLKRILERNQELPNPITLAPKTMFSLPIDGKKIAIYHGHDSDLLEALIKSELYDAIFTGHTHQYRNEVWGKTLILNPGSLIPARSSKPSGELSLAIYDTTTNSATHHSINVE